MAQFFRKKIAIEARKAADVESFSPKEFKFLKLDTTGGQHGAVHGNLARLDCSLESRETKNYSPVPPNFVFHLLWIEP